MFITIRKHCNLVYVIKTFRNFANALGNFSIPCWYLINTGTGVWGYFLIISLSLIKMKLNSILEAKDKYNDISKKLMATQKEQKLKNILYYTTMLHLYVHHLCRRHFVRVCASAFGGCVRGVVEVPWSDCEFWLLGLVLLSRHGWILSTQCLNLL